MKNKIHNKKKKVGVLCFYSTFQFLITADPRKMPKKSAVYFGKIRILSLAIGG